MTFSFPDGFLWGRRLHRTRSRAAGARTARARASGTAFRTHCRVPPLHGLPAMLLRPATSRGVQIRRVRELGLQAYRFSLSCRASCRNGFGKANAGRGLDFYSRLVDELTWPRNQALRNAVPLGLASGTAASGRLPSRHTAKAFVEYAEAVAGGWATGWQAG